MSLFEIYKYLDIYCHDHSTRAGIGAMDMTLPDVAATGTPS